MPTGNTQQIIDYGTTPNDGTGDPLRTAFIKTDENFDNVWLAGPVGSNVRINNNTISSIDTNGNITIKPDGVGIIQANASILPNTTNTRDLGSANLVWRRLYVGTLATTDMTVDGELTVTGNLTVDGDIIQIGNLVTDAKTIQLANTASTDAAADGSGITVGANDDVATLLYNSTTNRWTTNIGLTVGGDIIPSANGVYSLGNSTNYWSNIWVASNTIYIGGIAVGVTGNVLTVDGQPVLSNDSNSSIATTGNITANYFIGDGSLLTGISSTGDFVFANNQMSISNAVMEIAAAGTGADIDIQAAEAVFVEALNGEVDIRSSAETFISTVSGTHVWTFGTDGILDAPGNITANYFIGNGSQLTGLADGTKIINGTSQIDIPDANGNIVVGVNNVGSTEFTALGINTLDLLALGNVTARQTITATGNLSAGNISTGGAITASDEIRGQYFSIYNPDYYGDLGFSGGNVFLNANVAFQISTDYAQNPETGPVWSFGTDGTLTAPGDITVGGDVTGRAAASTLVVKAQPDSNTYIQLNNTVDSIVSIAANLDIVTDSANTAQTWTFGTDGTLTTPGNVALSGGSLIQGLSSGLYMTPDPISLDDFIQISSAAGQEGVVIGTTGGIILQSDAGNRSWSFGTNGTLLTPGAISATGNITASANINAAGGTFTGNITSTGNIATTKNIDVTGFLFAGVVSSRNNGVLSLVGSNVDITTGNVNLTTATATRASTIIASGNITGANVIATANVVSDGAVITTATIDDALITNDISIAGEIISAADITLRPADGYDVNFPVLGGNITFEKDTGNVVFPGNVLTGDISTTGTISATGNITTGNILTDGYYYANGAPFTPGSNYGDSNVVSLLSSFGSNTITTTGNITAANFIGNVSLTGNITGTSANVELVAGSYTFTFDNTGVATFPAIGGDEGGEIHLGVPAANTTLQNTVKIDVYQDRIRFFEGSANAKGAYIDIANCADGVDTAIGYLNIPQITLSANTTAALADSGKHFYSTTAGDLSILIPTNANVAFPTGSAFTVVVQAAGNVLVNADSGVTLYMAGSNSAGNRTVGAYGMATVMKVASDTWFINGTGVY